MQRKKGFTLVELLVAIVCATLVLSMITAAVIFLTRMNDGATKESETLFQLQTVKDYIQSHAETDLANVIADLNYHYAVEDGDVLHKTWSDIKVGDGYPPNEPIVVVKNKLIEKIEFSSPTTDIVGDKEVEIIKCTITYDGGQTFVFVAYTQETTSPSEHTPEQPPAPAQP